jgi:hypothetical protein
LVGSFIAFGAHAAAYAAVVVVVGSVYLQDRHGPPAGAGLVLAPVLAAAIVSAAPSGILLHRWGARRVVAALALCAITLAMVGRASGGGLGAVLPWLVAWGLSAGRYQPAAAERSLTDLRNCSEGQDCSSAPGRVWAAWRPALAFSGRSLAPATWALFLPLPAITWSLPAISASKPWRRRRWRSTGRAWSPPPTRGDQHPPAAPLDHVRQHTLCQVDDRVDVDRDQLEVGMA